MKREHDPSESASSEANAPKKEHSSTPQASHLALGANMYRNMMLLVGIREFFERALANRTWVVAFIAKLRPNLSGESFDFILKRCKRPW